LSMLGAAVVEEIVFRGYRYTRRGGHWGLLASAIGISLLFALLHPYLWEWNSEGTGAIPLIPQLQWSIDTQSLVATLSIFALSLWFYFCRFAPQNPKRSLLPCFFAHGFANLTVYMVKWSTGYVA